MFKTLNFLLCFIVFMLSSTSLQADEIDAGIMNFPPYFFQNEDNRPAGIYLNVMKKTLDHAGLKYRIDMYPAKRLYSNLGSGETNFYLGIKGVPEYDNKVLYSNTSISKINMRIYANAETPLPLVKEDIKNHKISTIRGYSYGGLITYLSDPKNNIEVASTAEHLSSFKMLKNKRVDYVINYKHPSENVLKSLDIPNIKYTNFDTVDIFFIVSKSTPNAQEVLKKIEAAYNDLIDRGELVYIENVN